MCERWWPTLWTVAFTGPPSAVASSSAAPLALARLAARSSALPRKPGRCSALQTFLSRWALGSRERATWSISSGRTPAWSSAARTARVGNPAQCFCLLSRSSSMAETSNPSFTRATEASAW